MNTTNQTAASTESAFVEHVFPWEKVGSYSRTDPYAKVWCYFKTGKPEKLVGSFRAIEQHIADHKRPCFAHVFFGRYDMADLAHLPWRERKYRSTRRGYWRFYNCGSYPTWLTVSERRVGRNVHFEIEHISDRKVTKRVRYRQLPKAFPKDFLYVVGGENAV